MSKSTEQHLQEFADMFYKAWAIWAEMEDATPKEKLHLERNLENTFWSEMLMKWEEMEADGAIINPGLDEVDAEVERIKNSPDYLLPDYLRESAS